MSRTDITVEALVWAAAGGLALGLVAGILLGGAAGYVLAKRRSARRSS